MFGRVIPVQQILLIIHLLIAISLVITVLMQRSEGGGLGIGGGGGGMVSSRGSGNFLTKATAVLAACFMATSMTLAILAGQGSDQPSLFQELPLQEEGQPMGEPAPDAGPTVPLD